MILLHMILLHKRISARMPQSACGPHLTLIRCLPLLLVTGCLLLSGYYDKSLKQLPHVNAGDCRISPGYCGKSLKTF